MTSATRLDDYLARFRRRLQQLALAKGVAIVSIAAFVISMAVVTIAIRSGFPDGLMIVSRLILAAVLGALVYFAVITPKRRIADGAEPEIERRTTAFAGRVEAYVDTNNANNPMRELLAEETLEIAAQYPPDIQVQKQEFNVAIAAGALAVAALLFVAIAGPGNYAYGVRSLWVGWALPGLLPPQSIDVTPGDDGIRLGGNVRIRAMPQGFDPREAVLHARFADGDWQAVPMPESDDAFEFTFFSVRQPLEYYVSAANVRSPSYEVQVVDLPNVENLALTIHYPEWTGREPEVRESGGDVRAIVDAQVEVTITADRQMTPGELIVDNERIPLDTEGASATATFTVENDGQYYIAAAVGGERIRLTDDYFITAVEDEAPTVKFSRPGRDWSASRIEEVTALVDADDDFRIESINLRYSVNGSDWQDVELNTATEDVEHVFFLEALADDGNALVPGDLIAYYAVAEDRQHSTSSDIFFIDVQPFDRRYTQAQAGGMAGQQGGPQNEVSQRQREIIISTWNLIREQSQRGEDEAYVNDNSALLSRLQSTLREQVTTLAMRTQARQMTQGDEDIARFVEYLEKAAEAMTPAAERLAEIELEQALLPEQEALQHLLAAEAVFTDINVALQNNRGGGGGSAGRDLTEMFELEMDLEKNQYETGSRATPQSPQQELEEAANELAELARRQEQLARNQSRAQNPTPEQRWRQEMLRREVEELRERLEQMAQNASESAEAQSATGESGTGSSSQSGQQSAREIEQLQRRLSSAERAMNEAEAAMRDANDPEALQRAMNEAQRQLEGARDNATEAQQRAMQASVGALANRADELHDVQAEIEETLQQAVRVAVGSGDDRIDSGLTFQQEYQIAEEKRQLLADLQNLQQEARRAANELEDNEPRTAGEILDAVARLQEQEIEARIAIAAAYIEQGEAVYVASSESAVTEALRTLRDDLDRANEQLGDGLARQAGGQNELRQTLAEARSLRRELQRLAEGTTGGLAYRGRDDLQRSTGVRSEDIDTDQLEQRAAAVSGNVTDLIGDIRASGVGRRTADELRRLAADVRSSAFSGNPTLLAEEARKALSLVEQLELALAQAAGESTNGARSDSDQVVPDAHREIIADYYRRLGQAEQ